MIFLKALAFIIFCSIVSYGMESIASSIHVGLIEIARAIRKKDDGNETVD